VGGHIRRVRHAGKLGQQNPAVKHEMQKMQSQPRKDVKLAQKVSNCANPRAKIAAMGSGPEHQLAVRVRRSKKKKRARSAGSLL
jgi:hypothetical protein